MSKQNLEMLEEIFKGAKMGMNATKLVMDKTKDTDLKNKLTGQYGSFSKTAQKAEEMLISNNKIPEESGMMEKAMLWSSVQLNSMLDTDASHIAEMVINGSTMSIVSMTKRKNCKFSRRTNNSIRSLNRSSRTILLTWEYTMK